MCQVVLVEFVHRPTVRAEDYDGRERLSSVNHVFDVNAYFTERVKRDVWHVAERVSHS